MSALRPIGTRFETTKLGKDNLTSNDHRDYIYTWEVVSHVKVSRFDGDEEGAIGEEIKCVDIREGGQG